MKRYLRGKEIPDAIPSKNTRLTQQKIILQYDNFRSFSQNEQRMLKDKASQLAKIHAQPRFLLTELLRILETERITVPGYSTFQKIIGPATHNEQARLNNYVECGVP